MGMSAAISTQKESTLPTDVHDRKYLIIFKGVETPPFFWDPGFWGLAVLNHTPEGIGVLKRCPRKLKACFLFNQGHSLLLLPVGRVITSRASLPAPSFWGRCSLPAQAPGIMKVPLVFPGLQTLAVWTLPTHRPLIRAPPPLVGRAPVQLSLTVRSSLLSCSDGSSWGC